ncbi:MAG: PcfB family protein, partial [Ruminococcus sp.]|nr:PcfB family protein [Ruminococcus sp.]
KEFERIARKYGVDFAVKRVKGDDPKFLVFFKGRDADALTSAFREYTAKKIRKEERPSVLKQLQEAVAAKTDPTKIKHKEHSL